MTYMLPGTLWAKDAVREDLLTRPNSWFVISARFSSSAAMFSLGCLFIPMESPCGKGPIIPRGGGEGGKKEDEQTLDAVEQYGDMSFGRGTAFDRLYLSPTYPPYLSGM